MLKKEFKEKDVERIRNLVKGKSGERTISGVGFVKKTEFHQEGDIWEQDGRQWTIKGGIKQNITKLDKAKKINKLPMFCPSCKSLMHKNRDQYLYPIHGKCLNCVIDMEAELHKQGLWEEYKRNIQNADIDGLIEIYKNWMFEQINTENGSFLSEKGDKEKWVGKVNEKRDMEAMKSTIDYLISQKK